MKALLVYLINVDGSRSVFPALENIARTHVVNGYTITPEWYDHWLDSLILAVRYFDDKFDETVELAWRMIMAPGIAVMKYFYGKNSPHPQSDNYADKPPGHLDGHLDIPS